MLEQETILFCFVWGLKEGSQVWERKLSNLDWGVSVTRDYKPHQMEKSNLLMYAKVWSTTSEWECVCICVSWPSWQITAVYLGRVWALPDHILLCHSTSILDYIDACVCHNYSLSVVSKFRIERKLSHSGNRGKHPNQSMWWWFSLQSQSTSCVNPSLLLKFLGQFEEMCARGGNVSWCGLDRNMSETRLSENKPIRESLYANKTVRDSESDNLFSCLAHSLSLCHSLFPLLSVSLSYN